MSGSEDKEKDSLEELVERFLAEKPGSVDGFLRRHPEHADELRELLPALEMLGERGKLLIEGSLENGRTLLERGRRMREGIAAGVSLEGPPQAGTSAKNALDDHVAALIARVESHGYPVGRFEPEGELARGGQGVVLAVWDMTLRRHLAMKVAQPASDGGATVRPSEARSLGRFLEEAQVTAQLDHPGIVPIHDLGLDSERRVYFTMKLVKGRDLRAIFELVHTGEEGWTVTRALSVLLKVCEAMAYAHSKGVIHRDLKPSNVMVGKFGEVYVMDWGLARALGSEDRKDIRIQPSLTSTVRSLRHEPSEEPDSPLVTMDGDVVGTPAFMPPEQARGELAAMGPHSDVYAVGAMLYQLLTGEMPYVSSGTRLSNRAVWALVQKGPPEPVHVLARDVPEELVAISEKAMAREVSARYPDMGALSEDLRAYLEHRVVQAHRTGALVELRKWVRRNQGLAASIAAAFVVLVLGLSSSLVFKARADRNAEQALENSRVATERADEVLRLSGFQRLADLEAEADRLWPADPQRVSAYDQWLERAQELVARLDSMDDVPGYRTQLAQLRERASPTTEEERETRRRAHPRFGELERQQRKVASLRAARGVREGMSEPITFTLDPSALPAKAEGLEALARVLVIPDRTVFGREAEGLALAALAIERVEDDAGAARAGMTLAWAHLANGQDELARTECAAALEAAPAYMENLYTRDTEAFHAAMRAAQDGSSLAEAERVLTALDAEVAHGPGFPFADEADTWWHAQLAKLVAAIEAFADPETGLIRGISEAHGWGIERRRTFAASIRERSLDGVEAARLWAAAIASIADPLQCPAYGGLRIVPQLGLLPIGRDTASGLWEFAHLQTGEPAQCGPDGELALREETGITLVLLPGGTFLMGAQPTDPDGPNYDPQAQTMEIVHEVTLSPFFLSKYEMTQAQWARFAGRNPSFFQPPSQYAPSLLHPVEQVNWAECVVVLTRIGLELPSDAQWEYGARAGTNTPWWTGEQRESLLGRVNLADQAAMRSGVNWLDCNDWRELDDGYAHHAPVDRFSANPFGLHNVHGNVLEWCLDAWGMPDLGSPVDPVRDVPDAQEGVLRSGGFAWAAASARSACRDSAPRVLRATWLGVRPARKLNGAFGKSR